MVCLNSLIKVSLAVSMSLFYFYLQLDLFKQRPDSFLRLAKVNLDVNKCYTGDWSVKMHFSHKCVFYSCIKWLICGRISGNRLLDEADI